MSDTHPNIETPEELERRAYSMAWKLKNSNFEEEVIYAKLEKQGIPKDLALEAARNIVLERQKDLVKDEKPFFNIALLKIGLGMLVALIYALVFPGSYILPMGFLVGGVILALASWNKMRL